MFTLVETATFEPGACFKCNGSAGPFLDSGADLGVDRIYICATCIGEASTIAGGASVQERAALEEVIENLRSEVTALEETVASQRENLERAEELRAAVRMTISHGGVVDQRNGKAKVRSVPGKKAVDLDTPIVAPEPEPAVTE